MTNYPDGTPYGVRPQVLLVSYRIWFPNTVDTNFS